MADYAHQQTDKAIEQLEKRLAKEYKQAEKELQAKLDDYLRRFKVKDAAWQQMVADGTKTAADYAAWRQSQIMVGERWAAMRDTIAQDLHNANVNARAIITGTMPTVYALNHNFATYQIEKAGRVNTSYTLYNREAVERLAKDNPELLRPPGVRKNAEFAQFDAYQSGQPVRLTEKKKKAFDKLISENKDIRWQKGQIQSVTMQSILQGESIPHMAQRIARTMGETNRKQSLMYARTAMTAAQNAGRHDAYKRAEEMGVKLKQQWEATLDERTRHEHRQLDGQVKPVDEPFEVDGYEIMYPGDPSADPEMVYNCRCTTIPVVDGWDSNSGLLRSYEDIEGQTYDEWREGHSKPERITKQQETGEAMRRQTIREVYGGNENGTDTPPQQPESQKTTQQVNATATDALAGMYEQHRIDNGLTSVPYDQLGRHSGMIVSADFGKMTPESAETFTQTISDLSARFDTPLTKIRTMTPEEFLTHKDAFAFVRHNYSTDTAELIINPGKCKDIATLTDRIRQLAERGYCVPVAPGSEARYIAAHEFAHTILNMSDVLSNRTNFVGADYEKIRAARAEIEDIFRRYTEECSRLDRARREATSRMLFATGAEEMEAAGREARAAEAAWKAVRISDYSLTGPDDFLAESFVSATLGTTSNPYAAEAFSVLRRFFGR